MNSKSISTAKRAFLIACACVLTSGRATATIVTPTASVTIIQSYAYTNLYGGDFVFSTSAAAPGCASGWYISASDPGFKSAVATVLAAQVAGSFVTVFGDNSQIWPGSPSGLYCHVQTVGIAS